jgi:NAD(P)-dependent dehydrogenase (short-subunit alcohol dehydrogenase family)
MLHVSRNYRSSLVVVTGGTGGLGRGVVPTLLADGARVAIPVLDPKELEGFPWRDHPDVSVATGVDLRSENSVRDYYASIADVWASIHLVGGFAMAPFVRTETKAFIDMFELNTLTAFHTTREAARAMKQGGRGGRIVNVAARPALTPVAGMVAYSVAKAGVVALTESAAAEFRDDGILVNAVAPSIMDTPANRAAMPDADHSLWPRVEEVATAIAFLASPENALTTGLVMPVYGRV